MKHPPPPPPPEPPDDVAFTVVLAVAALLAVLGSNVLLVTLAVLTIVPNPDGVTVIVTVVLAPLAKLPRLQLAVLVPLQLPCWKVPPTKVTAAGKASVSVMFLASEGPLL